MDDQKLPTLLVIPEEIYGQIINKLSLPEAIKVAKSNNKLAKAVLLYYPWDLKQRKVCSVFEGIDLSVLLKNVNIDRRSLMLCSISLKDEALALKILSIAKNNPEKTELQVGLGNYDNEIIINASSNGLTKLAKVLLDEYGLNPSVHKNIAFKLAFKYIHDDVVNLLLESPKFNYEDKSIINLVLEHKAEDVLTKIVKRAKYKDKATQDIYMNVVFKGALRTGMIDLVTYMINNEKVSTDRLNIIMHGFFREEVRIDYAHKVIKTLLDKYRNDASEGDRYPQFIHDILLSFVYNFKVFKMMMETKIYPEIDYNEFLRSSFGIFLGGGLPNFEGEKIAKYLLTKYESQVDPNQIIRMAFAGTNPRLRELNSIIVHHPKIKYNPNLSADILSKIYKYSKS